MEKLVPGISWLTVGMSPTSWHDFNISGMNQQRRQDDAPPGLQIFPTRSDTEIILADSDFTLALQEEVSTNASHGPPGSVSFPSRRCGTKERTPKRTAEMVQVPRTPEGQRTSPSMGLKPLKRLCVEGAASGKISGTKDFSAWRMRHMRKTIKSSPCARRKK